MSFLNFNNSALPKSCQSSIRRTSCCNCPSCLCGVASTSSSFGSSRSSIKMSKLLKNGAKNISNFRLLSESSKSSSSNTSISDNGASALDASEFHLLTILAGIDKMRLERDIKEASRSTPPKSASSCRRKEKRKATCFSEDVDNEKETDEGIKVLREVQHTVQVVLERKKLVPSSQLRKQREWMEKRNGGGNEKAATTWEKMQERLRLLGEKGKRKCRKVAQRF